MKKSLLFIICLLISGAYSSCNRKEKILEPVSTIGSLTKEYEVSKANASIMLAKSIVDDDGLYSFITANKRTAFTAKVEVNFGVISTLFTSAQDSVFEIINDSKNLSVELRRYGTIADRKSRYFTSEFIITDKQPYFVCKTGKHMADRYFFYLASKIVTAQPFIRYEADPGQPIPERHVECNEQGNAMQNHNCCIAAAKKDCGGEITITGGMAESGHGEMDYGCRG